MSLLSGSGVEELPFGIGFAPEPGFSLNGSMVDGGSVTLSGTGFGTKPNGAAPFGFIELGNGVEDFDARSRGSWTTDWNPSASMQQNVVAPNRTHSFEYPFDQDDTSQPAVNNTQFDIGGTADDLYLFVRRHINADGLDMDGANTNYNLKGPRYHPGLIGDNNLISQAYGQAADANGDPRFTAENTEMGGSYFMNGAAGIQDLFGLRKNEWVTEEWELHQSSAVDVSDATLKNSRDGFPDERCPPSPGSDTNFISRTTAFPNLYSWLFLYQDQLQGDPGFQMMVRMDLVYIEDSKCHIILSDEPTWEAATADPRVIYTREPQIITAWAANSIVMDLRVGVHDSLVNNIMYAIDRNGVSQKAGTFIYL